MKIKEMKTGSKTIAIAIIAIAIIGAILIFLECHMINKPLYDLMYYEITNSLICIPLLNGDAESAEMCINEKYESYTDYRGYVIVKNIPNELFDLKIVSYDANGKIIDQVEYKDFNIYDAENKKTLGDISESTQYLIVTNNDNLENIESLEKVKGLKGLSISYANSLQDISPIKGLTNLEVIDFNNNYRIDDISALENLTQLKLLNIGSNDITDISALENLTEIRYLNILDNKIEDISILSELTKLEWINAACNRIEDISSLGMLGNLVYVNVRGNKIDDYSPLKDPDVLY